MKKKIITIFSAIIFVGVPLAAFALYPNGSGGFSVDQYTYTAPATVLYETTSGGGSDLYFNATGTPVCSNEGTSAGTSGNLFDYVCNNFGGGYNSTTTVGSFEWLGNFNMVNCAALTYAACKAGNSSYGEADFSITSGGGGGSSTTALAPFNNVSSTQTMGGNVYNEVVNLPLYIFRTYGPPLVPTAIFIMLGFGMIGIAKLFFGL